MYALRVIAVVAVLTGTIIMAVTHRTVHDPRERRFWLSLSCSLCCSGAAYLVAAAPTS